MSPFEATLPSAILHADKLAIIADGVSVDTLIPL
jgi:hypothetical protein